MHGHINYVSQKLAELSDKPVNEDIMASLRSMRTMLISGLEAAVDHSERANRLTLVKKIDHYLRGI
jgi:hypothetical protein